MKKSLLSLLLSNRPNLDYFFLKMFIPLKLISQDHQKQKKKPPQGNLILDKEK